MKELEFLILGSLLHIPDYFIKVHPHLKTDLFQHEDCKTIYKMIDAYHDKYKTTPTQETLQIELESLTGLSQDVVDVSGASITRINSESFKAAIKKQEPDWLLDKTKKYLTERACYNVIMESLTILDETGKSKKQPDVIPDLFRTALSINFDEEVGHDYIEDAMERFNEYHAVESKVPFSLTMLNKITNGGMPSGSATICVASTGQGKSLFLTDQSAFWLKRGLNVLYISLEMSEVKIAERIDAKLFDLDIQNVAKLSSDAFAKNIASIKKGTIGKLKIKQYPPNMFHANHLRALLAELKQKSGFVPDCIVVDYVGIMASYRIKSDAGSYAYMKAVAEEIRGVGVEYKCRIYTAMQTNRDGIGNSDPTLNNLADSMGVSHTGDLIFALAGSPELEQVNLIRIIQFKNRYGAMTPASFTVGLNRSKMTFYDADLPSNQPSQFNPVQINDNKPKRQLNFG